MAGYEAVISTTFIHSKEKPVLLESPHGLRCMVLPRTQYPCDAYCRKKFKFGGKTAYVDFLMAS
jgi:hypothetical protein